MGPEVYRRDWKPSRHLVEFIEFEGISAEYRRPGQQGPLYHPALKFSDPH
jgi:hypothetical protein